MNTSSKYCLHYEGREYVPLTPEEAAALVAGDRVWVVRGFGRRVDHVMVAKIVRLTKTRAQGFPDDYYLHGTKTTQIAKIGNSVPPPVAEALVRAQFFGR